MKQKVIYYRDELNDEFAEDHIQAKKIDKTYRYLRSRILHVFWYRIIAMPFARLYMKLFFHHKIIGKEVFEKAGCCGYFLYGNHTHFLADAFVPAVLCRPLDVSVIVHPNNVSMPVLGRITPYLGALPLPDDGEAAKKFIQAVEKKIAGHECVMIYPEAHIWPFYTDIRPFTDASFRYPVKYRTPVFSLTNTYQKKKRGGRPMMVTYVDGPFYPKKGLSEKEQRKDLRNQVYAAMKKRAENNSVVKIRYEKIKS